MKTRYEANHAAMPTVLTGKSSLSVLSDADENTPLAINRATIACTTVTDSIDLSQFSRKNPASILEHKGTIVGHVIVKGDTVNLSLNEHAPGLHVKGLPANRHVLIDTKNDIELAPEQTVTLKSLTIWANNLKISAKTPVRGPITCEVNQTLQVVEQGLLQTDNVLALKAGTLRTEKESGLVAKQGCVLHAGDVSLEGLLEPGNSLVCGANNLSLATPLSLVREASIQCREQLHIRAGASLDFILAEKQDSSFVREIVADRLNIAPGGQLQASSSLGLRLRELDAQGKLSLVDTHIDLDSLRLSGNHHIKNTVLLVKNEAVFAGGLSSVLQHVSVEADRFVISGVMTCHDSEFIGPTFDVQPGDASYFKRCDLQIEGLLQINEDARTRFVQTSVNTATALLSGKPVFKQCELQTDTCHSSDTTRLLATRVRASSCFQDEGAMIENCVIDAQHTILTKGTAIQKTSLKANNVTVNASGTIAHSDFEVFGCFYTMDTSNITFQHCNLASNQSYSQGQLHFTEGSYCQSNYRQQSTGTLRFNNSTVKDKGLAYSLPDTHAIAENNSSITSQSVLFDGDSTWSDSRLETVGPVILCGKTSAKRAGIRSQESIYLLGDQHLFKDSLVKAGSDLVVDAKLSLENRSMIEADRIRMQGETSLSGQSMAHAGTLQLMAKLSLSQQSTVQVDDSLTGFHDSFFKMEEASITARDMNFFGTLQAKRARLAALSNMVFANFSDADLEQVKLEARDTLRVEKHSKLHGQSLETESGELRVDNSLAINGLKSKADTIHNSSTIDMGTSGELKANLMLYNSGTITGENVKIQATSLCNHFGKISSTQSSTIQAPLILNAMGDIASSGSLSIDSLVHLNVLGTERAFDYNSRAFYSFNGGLILPAMPVSLSDLFSWRRFKSFAKMTAIQCFGDYANLINLADMSLPYLMQTGQYAKQSAAFLYKHYYTESGDTEELGRKLFTLASSSINDVKQSIENTEKADILPKAMDLMSSALSLMHLTGAARGAYSELRSSTGSSKQNAPTPPADETQPAFNAAGLFGHGAGLAATAFAPSMNNQSIINNNMGLVASGNVMDSSQIEDNAGFKMAWNYTGLYGRANNTGGLFGANLVTSGESLTNFGDIFAGKSARVSFKQQIQNHEGARLALSNATLTTDALQNHGETSLTDGQLNLNTLTQGNTGAFNLNAVAARVKEDVVIQGQYALTGQSSLDARNISLIGDGTVSHSSIKAGQALHQSGHAVAQQSCFLGEQVAIDGLKAEGGLIQARGHLDIINTQTLGTGIGAQTATLTDSTFIGKKSAPTTGEYHEKTADELSLQMKDSNHISVDGELKTRNVVMDGMEIESGSHTDSASTYTQSTITTKGNFHGTATRLEGHSHLEATNVDFNGACHVSESTVHAEHSITQQGKLTGEKAEFLAQNIDLDGARLKDSQVHATDQLTIKHTETIDTALSGNKVDLRHSAFRSSSIPEPVSEIRAENTEEAEQAPAPTSTSNKIKADSLYTEDVIFEGQQVDARSLLATKTRVKHSSVTVAEDFTGRDLRVNASNITAHTVGFEGKTGIKDSTTKSGSTIHFDKEARLQTHNAYFEAEQRIVHASTHEQTGILSIEAEYVETTESSHIRSGAPSSTGKPNGLLVKGSRARFAGRTNIDHGNMDVKHIEDLEDFIGKRGKSGHQTFNESLAIKTGQDLVIDGLKARDCDLSVTASSIKVNSAFQSEHDLSLISTNDSLVVNADVKGRAVYLEAEKHCVKVNGATVEGTEYVHVKAHHNIELQATEKTYRDKHDIRKKFRQAQIKGGAGTEHTKGAGVILDAEQKVITDAAGVAAQGHVAVSGKEGVEFKARTHTYIAEKKKKAKRTLGVKHGEKRREKTATDVSLSSFTSTGGRVFIKAENGEVSGPVGGFTAAQGTDIYARGDIKLKGVKTTSHSRQSKKSMFGLKSSKHREIHEDVTLVDFVCQQGNTRLHSNEGNIDGLDLRFQGNGPVDFITPEGKTYLGNSKLNHSISDQRRDTQVSAPIVDATTKLLNGDAKDLTTQAEPTIGHAESLINPDTACAAAASVVNTGVALHNGLTAIEEGAYAREALAGMGFVPKVSVSHSKSKTNVHYQTVSQGGIYQNGPVRFHAKETVTLEGVPVVADSLAFNAREVTVRGHTLESSVKSRSTSVSIGASTTGITDASGSSSRHKGRRKDVVNSQISVKELVLNTDALTLDAANIACSSIKGNVDTLNILSCQSEAHSSTSSASASTTGAFSYQQSHSSSKTVAKAAGIHVSGDINPDEFHVREANLTGGEVTADGYNGFKPDVLHEKTLKDYARTNGFGLSGNINTILDETGERTPDSAPASGKLKTVTVSHTSTDYRADNKATVYGQDGVNPDLQKKHPGLNTSTSESKTVTRDRHQSMTLDIPVKPVADLARKGLGFFDKPPVLAQQTLPLPPAPEPLPYMAPEEESTSPIEPDVTERSDYDEAFVEEDADESTKGKGTRFRAIPAARTMGIKTGANGKQQLFNDKNGQYTSMEKELAESAELSQDRDIRKVVFAQAGEQGEGMYYELRYDTGNKEWVCDAELGTNYQLEGGTTVLYDGLFGQVSSTYSIGDADALIKGQAVANSKGASVYTEGRVGVMAGSAAVTYESPTLSFMGWSFDFSFTQGAGVGAKAMGACGVKADASKGKVGYRQKTGLFWGPGLMSTIKINVGIDMNLVENLAPAFDDVMNNNPHIAGIIQKMKDHIPLASWEMDEFDQAMDDVVSKAQATSWFGKKM